MMQEKKRSSWRAYPTLELELVTRTDVSVGEEFSQRRTFFRAQPKGTNLAKSRELGRGQKARRRDRKRGASWV
jgi:hypothetical protein